MLHVRFPVTLARGLFGVAQIIDILFTRTWSRYTPSEGDWFGSVYHWLNILEGGAWFTFSLLVLWRYVKQRNSGLELWYSLAFATFGISDFAEAWELSSWLIWLKLLNLIILLRLRRIVMTRFYPQATVY